MNIKTNKSWTIGVIMVATICMSLVYVNHGASFVTQDLNAVTPSTKLPQTLEAKEAPPRLGLLPLSEATASSPENSVRFAVISDIHILSSDTASMKFRAALEDLFANQQPPLDFVVLNGDLGEGTPADYQTLNQILQSVRTSTGKATAIVPNPGNHEFYKAFHDPSSNAWNADTFPNQETDALALQRFLSFAERDRVYTDHYINGYHFIFLGSEESRMSDHDIADAAYLSETQLTWLRSKISENLTPGKPVFVFLHQPVFSSNSEARTKFNLVVQQEELAKILQSAPNVVLFVGHLHTKLGSPDSVVKDGFTMFNSSSASRVRQAPEASQGLLIDVEDGVVNVRGRDFLQHEWLPEANYRLDLSE